MFLIGSGALGITYLMYQGHSISTNQHQAKMTGAESMYDPLVQSRIRNTLLYFGGSLSMTGIMTAALRNSSLAHRSPILQVIASIGFMVGTCMTDYDTQFALKHLLFGGFLTMTSLGLVPLIQMASMPIIYDALFATGIMMGGLASVACFAPND